MAIYTETLILVNNAEEASALNAGLDRSDIIYETFAIPYGEHTNSMRYQAIEFRYDGVRNTKYENYLTQNQRYDIRRGFEN